MRERTHEIGREKVGRKRGKGASRVRERIAVEWNMGEEEEKGEEVDSGQSIPIFALHVGASTNT